MWDCERSEKIRAESAQRQVRKMEVRYQRLDGKDGKDGKMGVTVMIDDRCDLAAYMDGVWEAYMEFRADGHSPHSRSLQNRSKDHTIHMTAQDLSVPF